MIPAAEQRDEFERNAELSRLATQVARLLAEHKLGEDEVEHVLREALQELMPPGVQTVVDRAKRRVRGW